MMLKVNVKIDDQKRQHKTMVIYKNAFWSGAGIIGEGLAAPILSG
jgi:hypothetical protein